MGWYILIKNKNKGGQAWSLDIVIASIIFIIGIISLYVYAINYSSQTKNQLDEFFYEGELASKLILSEKETGILSDGKMVIFPNCQIAQVIFYLQY